MDISEILQAEADRGRAPSLDFVLEELERGGQAITGEALHEISAWLAKSGRGQAIPQTVLQGVVELVVEVSPESILDPHAGLGALIGPAVDAAENSRGVAYTNSGIAASYRAYELDVDVEWRTADSLEELGDRDEEFDAVVSLLPWGSRVPAEVQPDGIHDGLDHLLLLESAQKLSDSGRGIFAVTPSFFRDSRRSVFANMETYGLSVDAALYILPGAFDNASIASYLVVVSREASETDLFTAILPDDEEGRSAVLENFRKRRDGAQAEFGRWVPRSGFVGFPQVQARARIKRLASRLGIPPVPLGSIALELNRPNKKKEFEHKPSSVYVPIIGTGPAVTAPAEFRIKPQNYLQVVVDPEKASARYLAGFLSTALGELVRETATSGTTIPKISRGRAPDMPVYLPDLDVQREIVELEGRTTDLIRALEEVREKLWRRPDDVDASRRDLARVNREDRFSDWLGSLPFPLGSILWTYQAAGDDEERVKRLLHFFEATAEFLATIHLSAAGSDEEFRRSEMQRAKEALAGGRLSLERSSFGTWVVLLEVLAKAQRRLLSEGEAERVTEMYRTSNRDVLDMLLAKPVIHILKTANSLRNSWSGHGGFIGNRQAAELSGELESLLSDLRGEFTNLWEDYQLVRPRFMVFEEGSYIHQADRLMGFATPFKRIDVRLDLPMEKTGLYLVPADSESPLKLLPFLRVSSSPESEQNACYFFNRIEKSTERFVAYQFTDEAELVEEEQEVRSVLPRLFPGESSRLANDGPAEGTGGDQSDG